MNELHHQEKMEREKGLEPSTLAMARRCSSQLSYSRILKVEPGLLKKKNEVKLKKINFVLSCLNSKIT
jgi:hypothetical protein